MEVTAPRAASEPANRVREPPQGKEQRSSMPFHGSATARLGTAARPSLRRNALLFAFIPGIRHLKEQFVKILKDFAEAIFDPYRPELHYMRGPGPKWRAKH